MLRRVLIASAAAAMLLVTFHSDDAFARRGGGGMRAGGFHGGGMRAGGYRGGAVAVRGSRRELSLCAVGAAGGYGGYRATPVQAPIAATTPGPTAAPATATVSVRRPWAPLRSARCYGGRPLRRRLRLRRVRQLGLPKCTSRTERRDAVGP